MSVHAPHAHPNNAVIAVYLLLSAMNEGSHDCMYVSVTLRNVTVSHLGTVAISVSCDQSD